MDGGEFAKYDGNLFVYGEQLMIYQTKKKILKICVSDLKLNPIIESSEDREFLEFWPVRHSGMCRICYNQVS